MPHRRSRPIGVFDSGVGGLTVVSAVLSRLPHEHIVYLGDTARVPYGTRSAGTVLKYSRNAARFLLRHDVKLLLIACNTASAAALPGLRAELPVGVLGAVEPGAQAAAHVTRSGEVGVLGTLATIRSGAYERALLALSPSLRIHVQPCPLLVPIVEEGWNDESDLQQAEARKFVDRVQVLSDPLTLDLRRAGLGGGRRLRARLGRPQRPPERQGDVHQDRGLSAAPTFDPGEAP